MDAFERQATPRLEKRSDHGEIPVAEHAGQRVGFSRIVAAQRGVAAAHEREGPARGGGQQVSGNLPVQGHGVILA